MENKKRLIDANLLHKRLAELGAEPNYQHDGEDWGVGVCMADSIVDEMPTVDVFDVQEFEKQKQETLKWMDDFISEWQGYTQSYIDVWRAKIDAMETAKQLVNRYLCGVKIDG